MPKVLATLLTFAALVSAAANAPGVMFAQSKQPLATQRANVDAAGTAVPPEVDQGAWLDAALSEAQVASWHHSWTDEATDPDIYYAAPGANPYGHSANWKPQGVLLAYEPQYASASPSDVAYFDALNQFGMPFDGRGRSRHSRSGGTAPSHHGADAGNTNGEPPAANPPPSGTSPADTSNGDETGPAGPDAPTNEQPPVPHDDVDVLPPGPKDEPTDTSPPQPPREEQPVSVPEPAPMGLLALGLAGIAMFGRRRSLI